MDPQKLRTLVFEKTGIKVDTHDPIFALVALNEAVLAESVGVHIAAMDDATRRLTAQIKHLQGMGGGSGPHDPEPRAETRTNQGDRPRRQWPLMLAGAAIALVGAASALGGQALFMKNAAVVQAAPKPISPEQAAMIRNAEKITKAVQNLDEETRARIQAEMQKK